MQCGAAIEVTVEVEGVFRPERCTTVAHSAANGIPLVVVLLSMPNIANSGSFHPATMFKPNRPPLIVVDRRGLLGDSKRVRRRHVDRRHRL